MENAENPVKSRHNQTLNTLQMKKISILFLALFSSTLIFAQTPTFDGWYRLKTMFRGDGECLEGNQKAGDYGGVAFMDKCQNVSGQLWKIEDAGNGYYRLKTKFRGDGECLEGNQKPNFKYGEYSGGAHMDKTQNVSGQLWKFEKVK